jgi:hypothetical protein
VTKLTITLFGAVIGRSARHSRREGQRWQWSRLFQKANGFINRATVLDHVKWSRFLDESGVKAGIFAGQIELTNDGRGRKLFGIGGRGGLLCVKEIERKDSGGDG